MKNNSNQAVLILGMHRSGTSVLAGVLSMLGINPGGHLMPAHAEVNPKGFWEHAEIVDLHDQMLDALGSSWDDVSALPQLWWTKSEVIPFRTKLTNIVRRDFGQSPLWLLKDPRLCRLLPLWLDILHELGSKPYFVICLRNPSEVAASLGKRDGIIGGEAYLLWLRYVLDAERWSRSYSRNVVTYETVLTNWRSVSNILEQGLGVELKGGEPEVANQISEFIEPGLRHYIGPTGRVADDGRISELANKVYQLMLAKPAEDAEELLSALGDQVDELCELVFPWTAKNRLLRKEVEELRFRSTWQHSELCRVKSTISWRITKPLRFCAFLLRHILATK